jgi:hypothetical protein
VRNQGWIAPTAARKISFADSLAFEEVHERTYRDFGFQLIDVPAGPLTGRAELVLREVGLSRPARSGRSRSIAGRPVGAGRARPAGDSDAEL